MIVKVANCKDAFEGEVVKGMLEANGIECYLQNENMSQIYGGIQAMAINVMVKEEDAEKAKELLSERPEEVIVEHPVQQTEHKTVKQLFFESLLFTVIVCVLFYLIAWVGNWAKLSTFSPNRDMTIYYYILFAAGFFLGTFFFRLLLNKRK
ncbi:MAG: DUF2007 domain-containing protein [Prevotella sp.]|nr:DUF2007 domain-containing protein [Prevotella sp.]